MNTPENSARFPFRCWLFAFTNPKYVLTKSKRRRSHWISRGKSNRVCDVHIKYFFLLQSFMFHEWRPLARISFQSNVLYFILCWDLSPAEYFIRNRLNWVARQKTRTHLLSKALEAISIRFITSEIGTAEAVCKRPSQHYSDFFANYKKKKLSSRAWELDNGGQVTDHNCSLKKKKLTRVPKNNGSALREILKSEFLIVNNLHIRYKLDLRCVKSVRWPGL